MELNKQVTIKYPVPEDRPWFTGNFWPEGVPHQLDYDYSMTTKDLLIQAVSKYGENPAMWFLDSWITYRQFKDMVDRLATGLAKLGVQKGDCVAFVLPNCPQWVISYYAVTAIGAIASGVNPTYKPMEVLHQLKSVEAKYLVVLDGLYKDLVAPIVKQFEFKKVISTNIVDLASGLSPIKKVLGKMLK